MAHGATGPARSECYNLGEQASRRFSSAHCLSRGVAQPGRAPGSGPGGRRFKSSLPDHIFPSSFFEDQRIPPRFVHSFSLENLLLASANRICASFSAEGAGEFLKTRRSSEPSSGEGRYETEARCRRISQ